jgi:hypothetical protein
MALFCLTREGTVKWQRLIHKAQFSRGNALGLSFIPKLADNQLKLIALDNGKKGAVYMLILDIISGEVIQNVKISGPQTVDFTKNYSCWVDDQFVLLCTMSAGNSTKRTLKLVELK